LISGGQLFLSYGAVHNATTLAIVICVSVIVGCLVGGALFFFLLKGRARTILVRALGALTVLALLISVGALAADAVKLGNEAKSLQTWAGIQKVKLTPSQAHDLLVTHTSVATVKGKVVVARLGTDKVGAAELTYS
jgi:hypothetical protein